MTETLTRLTTAQIAHRAADIIIEKKGERLAVLDVTGCSDLADYMIVATGTNKRQVQAIAEEIDRQMKKAGVVRRGVTGLEFGRWVLIDLGDVVVHVMSDEARRFYDLEALWADALVVRRGVEV